MVNYGASKRSRKKSIFKYYLFFTQFFALPPIGALPLIVYLNFYHYPLISVFVPTIEIYLKMQSIFNFKLILNAIQRISFKNE